MHEDNRVLVVLNDLGDVLIAKLQVLVAQAIDVPSDQAELVWCLRRHDDSRIGLLEREESCKINKLEY